jgi:anti-sigma regulatory factor (Ser/Thr protein kinase)
MMNRHPDRLPQTHGLIAFADDQILSERLTAQADALGIRLEPLLEGLPPLTIPCVVIGVAHAKRVLSGLSRPAHGFVEWSAADGQGLSVDCLDHAARGGQSLSINTRSAYEMDAANQFTQSLLTRFPHLEPIIGDIELALAEGVANAIIHGNLGIGSKMRNDLQGFAVFQATLQQRLNDPALIRRRVEITAIPVDDHQLEVCITDQGDGYDCVRQLGMSAETEAKSGRGLGLIRQLANGIEVQEDGRRLRMLFCSPIPLIPPGR